MTMSILNVRQLSGYWRLRLSGIQLYWRELAELSKSHHITFTYQIQQLLHREGFLSTFSIYNPLCIAVDLKSSLGKGLEIYS